MLILGLETSCDETGVALYDSERGLLAHQLYSQIALHADYGGVVPELASRDHVRKIAPLVTSMLADSGKHKQDLDGVAYTAGPGLMGALLVGAAFGRSLAWGLGIPALPINHMEGHLLAAMLESPAPEYPFLCLLVSGGHTQLFAVTGLGRYSLLGESLDDAAGEAFDKTAKMLGLGYPGGPALAELAKQGRADRFKFPRPMTDRPGLDFSFSGLKTHAITTFRDTAQTSQDCADVARAFQDAVVDTMLIKVRRALDQTDLKAVVVAGGVGANRALRERLAIAVQKNKAQVFYPRPEFCTDNGAMIAYAGALRLASESRESLQIQAKPRWQLTEIN